MAYWLDHDMLLSLFALHGMQWEQWGNPNEPEYYDYMKSYSPIDNIRRTAYPNILLTGGASHDEASLRPHAPHTRWGPLHTVLVGNPPHVDCLQVPLCRRPGQNGKSSDGPWRAKARWSDWAGYE